MTLVGGGFNTEQWFLLPLKLRQRWWRETDYGKNPPPAELRAAIKAALEQPSTRER